jgi:TonB family protein
VRKSRRSIWQRAVGSLLSWLVLLWLGSASAYAMESDPAAPKLTKPPRVLSLVEPRYPERAKAEGRTASVLLAIDIDAQGRVSKAEVLSPPNPEFDAPALEAVRLFVFQPAEVNHEPAPVRISYRYRFVLAPAAEVPPVEQVSNVLEGRVLWADGSPAAGIRLQLSGAQGEVATDGEGRFSLGQLAAGVYDVRLSGEGIVPVVVEQRMPLTDVAGVVYRVDRSVPGAELPDEEIVVRTRRRQRAAGQSRVSAKAARQSAGAIGDALNVVQNLPGVASSPSGTAGLVVWGAAPAETRVYIDDVPVPRLYHQGGFRSVIHDGLVDSVELVPGGYGPDYGQGLGGLVRVETHSDLRGGLHGEAAADVIGAAATLSVHPAKRALSAVAGGRVGYLDRVLSAASRDVEAVVPLSAYRDYAVKALLHHDSGDSTSLMVLGSFDDVERNLPASDPNSRRSEMERSAFHRAAISHQHRDTNGDEERITLWGGLDDESFRADFDGVRTALEKTESRYGFRGARRVRLHSTDLHFGLELEGSHGEVRRAGTLGQPGREGDILAFGQTPGAEVAADEWIVDTVAVAAFVQTQLHFGDKVEVTPGLRVEPILQAGDRIVPAGGSGPPIGYGNLLLALGPRLAAKWRATEALELHAATGLYDQPPAALDLSPVFGGTDLGLSHAAHGVLGAAYEPWKSASLEAVVFAKSAWDLVTRSRREPPAVAGALVNGGRGRTLGGELVLRQNPWRGWSGWVSYSLSKSERKDGSDDEWRLFDFDQTHQMTAVLGYELDQHWSFGARFRAASGFPRTEVTSAYYDARLGRYQPRFGAHNGVRLPTSFQLDLHAEYTQAWSDIGFTFYVDVLNATNSENPVETVYNHDYSERDFLTSLPILAVLGGRVEF